MKQLAAMERRIQRISSSCLLLYCVFAFVNRACQLRPLLLSSPFAFFISFERYAQPPIERKINHAYIDRSSRYAIEIPRVIFCYREGSGGRNERERGGEEEWEINPVSPCFRSYRRAAYSIFNFVEKARSRIAFARLTGKKIIVDE